MSFTISAQLNAAQSESERFLDAKRKLELERLQAENRNIVNSANSASSAATSTGSLGDLQERLANLGLTQQEKLMGLSNKYRTLEGSTQGQIDNRALERQLAESETRKYLQDKDIGGTNLRQERDISGMNLRQTNEIRSREGMQQKGFDNVEQQRSRDAARAQGALRSVRSSGL